MSDKGARDARLWVLVLAVAGLAAIVFLPAISGGWIYDDHPLIAENPYIRSFSWWSRWLTSDFWDVNEEIVQWGDRLVYWRPAITASYAVDWQLGGGSPLMFHISNTLLHACMAGLSFVVLRRWINSTWAAVAAAVLFAVHPTKAESVAWIAGRTDVVCMIAILVAAEGIARRLRDQRFGIPLEVLGTALAYLSKEQAIVLPAFAVVEAWVAMGRPAIDRHFVAKAIRTALPQTLVAASYLVARAIVMPIEASLESSPLPIGDHVQVVLETFGRFISLTFYPHELSIQQGLTRSLDGHLVHSTLYIVLGTLGVAALVAIAAVARRRFPVATIGIGLYMVTLLPTSNLKYTEMATLVSERFLYLPMIGLALVCGAGLAEASRHGARRWYALAATAALALGMIALSRSADYADERRFWAREKQLHPDSPQALSFEFRSAIEERRFQSALAAILEKNRLTARWDRSNRADLAIGFQVASTLIHLVPDHDTAGLRSIDAFCADVLDPAKTSASLALRGATITLPIPRDRYERWIEKYKGRLLALRADLNSRLGDDEAGLRYAAQARDVCERCQTVVIADAIAHGRAGKYDEAFRALNSAADYVSPNVVEALRERLSKAKAAHDLAGQLSGPQQLQARANELSALELWGRAYDVLAPHKEAIQAAPRFAMGFAELAFRAGETAIAREVVGAYVPSHEVDSQLSEWAAMMGWVE
jgi:hypothetical protein